MREFIQFLGCGDAFASGGRFHTCFYVSDHKFHFLIDFGATSLTALKRYRVPEVDSILITHFHGDHIGGLPYFFLHEEFVRKRQSPLKIIGPVGLQNKVEQLTELLYPGTRTSGFGFYIDFMEYTEGAALSTGPLQISAYKVIHATGVNPHALRITFNGKIITYSGDTEWTGALVDAAEKADLFICDCNFFDTLAPNHLSHQTILAHQAQITARKIILTHMGDEMLKNLEHARFDYAEDGKIVEL